MYNRYVMNRHEYRVKLVFALYQSLLLNKEISRSVEDNFDDEEKNEYVTVLENDLIINKDNYIFIIMNFFHRSLNSRSP